MADYIDRAEAIKAVYRKCTACSVLTDKDDKAFSKAHCAEIRALQELPSAPGWISVKDRLPEPWVEVLVFRGKEWPVVSDFVDTNGRWRFFNVTHWIPSTAPPKEG